jgi:hypothetical protein
MGAVQKVSNCTKKTVFEGVYNIPRFWRTRPFLGLSGMDNAREWCEQIVARRPPSQRIPLNGPPYLTRYFLSGWNPVTKGPGPSVYLHHFVASDPADQVHSHPWDWALSVILVGGYVEHRCQGDASLETRTFRPGDINTLRANDRHRIELLGPECWSLFLVGAFEKPWDFVASCAEPFEGESLG